LKASAALVILLATAAPLAAQSSRYTLSGREVSIFNLVGTVTIEPGTGSAVVVEVTRRGNDAARLTIEESDTRLSVVYPSDEIVYAPMGRGSNTQLQVREDGTFNGGDWRGRSREVRISGRGDGLEAYADMRITVPAGRTLAMHLAVGSLSAENVAGNLTLDVASADVEVRGTRGTLNVDVGSGNVTASNVEGDLVFDTGSGDVTVTGARAGTLTLDTGSGSMTVTDARAESVDLDAGSGDIRMEGVSSPVVRLDTGSGNLDVTLTSDIERLELDTGSGDVTIRAPANIGARVDIETGSGRIGGDLLRGLDRDEDDGRVTGTLGDGRGTITVDAGSGDVTFLRR
jgi:hypothetical protein